jgi:predicted RNase H-like nuclease (RuvC/YqgF family)
MAFAVEEFRDLLALLREHPEWKAELRREILGEELLSLPELVRENTVAIRELRESIQELRASDEQLRQSDEELRASVQELRESVQELRESVQELRESVAELWRVLREFMEASNRRFDRLERDVAMLKGVTLETWYMQRPHLVVRGLRRARVVDLSELEDRIEAAGFSEADEDNLREADLIVAGREGRGDDAADVHVAVEVSNVIDSRDVALAMARADLIARLGLPARAAVAGHEIVPAARELAEQSGVAVHLRPAD